MSKGKTAMPGIHQSEVGFWFFAILGIVGLVFLLIPKKKSKPDPKIIEEELLSRMNSLVQAEIAGVLIDNPTARHIQFNPDIH